MWHDEQRRSWEPPSHRVLKVNVDGAFDARSGKGGVDIVNLSLGMKWGIFQSGGHTGCVKCFDGDGGSTWVSTSIYFVVGLMDYGEKSHCRGRRTICDFGCYKGKQVVSKLIWRSSSRVLFI